MKRSEIELFEKVTTQLNGLYREIAILTNKAPNGTINKFKLKFINTTLASLNGILGEKFRPFPEFDVFDVDDLPNNSDVSLILTQYKDSASNFKAANSKSLLEGGGWIIEDEDDEF
ncbi:MAG: hypothetical protein J0I20_29365 [Chloroflexi bacterium]|jgi:hypothetical protein|nr:hypothetical protein [Chloroflexota bacterium]OJW05711.1 MAG: hypothetical protein BGO39_02570 [Chloroflexi bacterium 54-19]